MKKNANAKKPSAGKSSKFFFASSDIRYRNQVEKEDDVESESSGEDCHSKSAKKDISSGISSSSAPASLDPHVTELELKISGDLSNNKLPGNRHGSTDLVVKRARDCLWPSVDTPPVIEIPSVLHYIRKEGDKFGEAMETLLNAKEIGLSVQFHSQLLARDGSLSLLCISTASEVFIFDVLEMGAEVFKWGLRQILGNPECLKVVHDGRLLRLPLSDLLVNQFDLELVNVFDTLAAHLVFTGGLTKKEIKRSKPLHSAVRDYLGVRSENLYIPRYSYIPGEMWLTRPLEREEELLIAAARETIYLLELSNILRVGLELPVRTLTEIIMEISLDEEQTAATCHIVPAVLQEK